MFLFYAPGKIKISSIQFERYTVILPENSQGYFTSKFRTDEIEEVCSNEQSIWIGILNKSLPENIEIKKKKIDPLDFLSKNKRKYQHQT